MIQKNELKKQTLKQAEKMNTLLPGEGTVKDFGEVIYTLLYLKWITNINLLYSTENSAQCYMPASMGGGFWGRMDTCICMSESLHCSPETITTLLISCTPIHNVLGGKN